MTSDAIAARNRANAQESTGPGSARGKAIVAGNALRHGATARPDPDSVAAWLAIILDRPHITPGDLMPEDEAGFRALALAQAEARLVAADRALRVFEAGGAEPSESLEDLRHMAGLISEDLQESGIAPQRLKSGLLLLQRIARINADEMGSGGKQHRRLRRYLREARARRWRAFEAWAAFRRDGVRAA